MSCYNGSELLTELEYFMDEVECIDNLEDDSASPPESDWLVHFNAVTKQTIYRHIYSGEERADMPMEYATYLDRFNRYMTRCLSENGVECASENICVGNAEDTVEVPLQNRKRKKPCAQIQTGNTELSEFIGYSASSDSDMNSEKTGTPERGNPSSFDTGNSPRSDFVGSKLPGTFTKHMTRLKSDCDVPSDAIASPREATAPSSGHGAGVDINAHRSPICSQHCSPRSTVPAVKLERGDSEETLQTENASENNSPSHIETTENKRSRREKKKYKERQLRPASRVEDMVELLKDKFASFNVVRSEISTLHRLYIQMTTRLEDWRRGKLSSRYFSKRLDELEDRLFTMASESLPSNWTCHWDVDSGQYYYYNKTTKTSQWSFPEQEQEHLSPPTVTLSATIVRPPQLSSAENVHKTAETYQSHTGNEYKTPQTSAQILTEIADSTPTAVPSRVLTKPAVLIDDTASGREKEELLNAQLQEFAIACLEFASPTRQDVPFEDRLLVSDEEKSPPAAVTDQPSGQQRSEFMPSNSKPHTRKKKTVSTTKGLTGGGKDLPNLIQKWQHLQKSL